MSSFTKSILYSTTVLVAGLVATFTIYNNATTTSEDGAAVANISPAAGENAIIAELNDIITTAESMQDTAADSIAAPLNDIETSAGSIDDVINDTREKILEIQKTAKTPNQAKKEAGKLQKQVIKDAKNLASPESIAAMEASQAELDAAIAQAAAAQDDLNAAEADLSSAQRTYDADPTEENALVLAEAQADYDAALQVTTDLQNTASTF